MDPRKKQTVTRTEIRKKRARGGVVSNTRVKLVVNRYLLHLHEPKEGRAQKTDRPPPEPTAATNLFFIL